MQNVSGEANPNYKHGFADTRPYRIWTLMKDRCSNPKHPYYYRYGGRGIKVCNEWLHDFQAFHTWATANGYDETAPRGQCTLDRINNDGNYCPENCRWVDMVEQSRNRCTNVVIEFRGERKSIAEWAAFCGVNESTLQKRLKKGMDIETALTKPIRKYIKKITKE